MTTHPPTVAAAPVNPPSQPRFLDYWLLLVGVGVSALVADMTGLKTKMPDGTSTGPGLQALLNVLPTLLFLPVGVILFWPMFHALQWVAGRPQGLAIGEWLLGLAWLGAVALTCWAAAKGFGYLPDAVAEGDVKKYVILGYILFMLSMGALAAVIWLLGLVTRAAQPWTHTLSLALLIWPAVPMLIVWARNMKME